MDIDDEGVLAYWVYIDSDGDVYSMIDPDMSKCSSEFLTNLLKFINGEKDN